MEKEFEMKNRMKEFCRQKELLSEGDRVLLGLSGGADSVCLFLMLLAVKEELRLTLFPVHVNHNIRGEEAMRDQLFCEELCRQHNLELYVASVQVPELADKNGWTLEEAGRNARYRVFEEMKEKNRCNRIAVAHHKNDQAETVLFQLFRGSRLRGLSGMEAKNGSIIRPLLFLTREEIEDFLEEKQQTYCIDRTNFEEEYTRNLIRHRILTAAQEIQPRAVEHIAETADYLGRLDRFLDSLVADLYREAVKERNERDTIIDIRILKETEPLLAERVVYKALCAVAGSKRDITSGFVTDCMELMDKQTGRQLQLPYRIYAVKMYNELWLCKGWMPMEHHLERHEEEITGFPFEVKLPRNGGTLTLTMLEFEEKSSEKLSLIPKNTYTKWFDYDKIGKVVSLRSPTSEDFIVFHPDGRKKRVLEVLANFKIPREERISHWILAAGTEALWIPGMRSSEAYHVTEKTKRVLVATIIGGSKDGR